MTSDQAATLIGERFSGAQVGPPVGRTDDPAPAGRGAPRPDAEGRAPLAVQLPVDQWVAFARFAKETLRCRFFAFSTAIDWKEQGLEVVARVDNLDDNVSVMMRTRLDPAVPACPSLTPVYRGADWMERECYDMFGIRFEGHPDLRRILLTDDWVGHPLLKSYAVDTPHPPYR